MGLLLEWDVVVVGRSVVGLMLKRSEVGKNVVFFENLVSHEIEIEVLHITAAVVADNSLAFFRITWGILDAEISLPEGKGQTFKGVWFTMFRVLNHLFDVRFGFLVSKLV